MRHRQSTDFNLFTSHRFQRLTLFSVYCLETCALSYQKMNEEAIAMKDAKKYQRLLFNAIVKLPDDRIRCCCCFQDIPNTDLAIKFHLSSNFHVKRMSCYQDVRIDLDELTCRCMFENWMGISIPSYHKEITKENLPVYRYNILCYYCKRVLKGGTHAMVEHCTKFKRHGKPVLDMIAPKKQCEVCCISMFYCSHYTSYFHLYVMQDQNKYCGIHNKTMVELKQIAEKEHNFANKPLKKVPKEFEDITARQYCNVWKSILREEKISHIEFIRACKMTGLSVHWEGEVGLEHQPRAYFLPKASDQNIMQLKVGDKLILHRPSDIEKGLKNWSMACEVEWVSDYGDGVVCVKLKNGSGVYKDIGYPYEVVRQWDPTPFDRMNLALDLIRKMEAETTRTGNEKTKYLLRVLLNRFGLGDEQYGEDYTFNSRRIKLLPQDYSQIKLNDTQLAAMQLALENQFALIHGFPGSGKSKIIIMLVWNMLLQKKDLKILICTPSNTAVDLLALKLHGVGISVVRKFSRRLDRLGNTKAHPLGLTQQTLRRNKQLSRDYERYIGKEMSAEEEMRYSDLLDKKKQELWDSMEVTCCTCITAGSNEMRRRHFDVVLIDEAAQASEPECLLPIIGHGATKVVLFADPNQLGPVIKSEKAKEAGLGRSLFERLLRQPNVPKIKLVVQYRMHPDIADFPSRKFYKRELKNGVNKEDRQISFPWLRHLDKPIVFFNVSKGHEKKAGTSYANLEEATKIFYFLCDVIASGIVNPANIGVISPYEGQRRLLRIMIRSIENDPELMSQLLEITIANVDAFQGAHREIIIFSCVRSNYKTEDAIGFLKDPRRLNVALTRCKSKLIVFGHEKTLKTNALYADWISSIDSKLKI